MVAGGPYLPPVAGKKFARSRRGVLVLLAFSSSSSSSAVVEGDSSSSSSSVSLLERCLVAPPAVSSSSSSMLSPVMKGQYGAFGAVTLEKGKLDMSQKQSQSSPEVLLSLFLSFFLTSISVWLLRVFQNYLRHYTTHLVYVSELFGDKRKFMSELTVGPFLHKLKIIKN